MRGISEHVAHKRALLRVVAEQLESRAFVKVPDFVRLHDVPATGLIAFEKVIDRGDRRADTARGLHAIARAVDLAKAPAFRMGLETELVDQCADSQRGCRSLVQAVISGQLKVKFWVALGLAPQPRRTLAKFLRAAIVLGLLAPAAVLATVAAAPFRMMVVHLHDSSAGILEAFRTMALAVGLTCQWLQFGKDRALQCSPAESSEKFKGLFDVVGVQETRSVVVSAFSSNVSTPHGELDPPMEEALRDFRQALTGNPAVSEITECSAPDLNLC